MALNQVAIQMFRDQFANVYQATESRLAGTMMEFRGLTGDAYKIPQAGQIVLHDRGAFHSDIAPTIPNYTRRVIVFENKLAKVPSDIFEQLEVNASERQNYAKVSAYAIVRMEDQIKMNALNASTTTNTVPVGTTNLTVNKLLDAKYFLDKENVPMAGRYFLGHASQARALLKETEVVNSDYNTTRALVNGVIDSYLGFKFKWVGDMLEGGLYKTGDNRTNFAWHEDAMAAGYRLNPQVTVDWEPGIQSFIIVPKVSLGAIEVLPPGIVKIVCDETK